MVIVIRCAGNRIAAGYIRGVTITSVCAITGINVYILCFIKCIYFMFIKKYAFYSA